MSDGGPPERPLRCLVMAPPDLVRLLHHVSVLPSLAASGRQLVLLARDSAAAVLEPTLMRLRLDHTPDHLHAPLSLDRSEVTAGVLRSLEFDEAVLLDPRGADVRLALAAGIRRRWGYASGLAGWGLRPRVPRPGLDGRHEQDDARELVEAMGATWTKAEGIEVSKSWRDTGDERLRAAHLKLDERPIVGIYPGKSGAPRKRRSWPAEHFEEMMRRLRRKRPAWQMIILATEPELWQAVLLYEKTGKIHPVVGPDLAPESFAALLNRLDLVIGADTWPLHLAAALGVATVGFFEEGASRRAPQGPLHRRLERKLSALDVDEVVAVAAAEGDALEG
ncbi:MAG: glycosyltransferase family 9 protein [Acidobacteriota bacterium]